MTDEQPADAIPGSEPRQDAPVVSAPTPPIATAPPPPASTAPPPAPAPAPAPATWSPTPTPAPTQAPSSGSPVRPGVAVIGVLALLAVLGTVVWGGGSLDSSRALGSGGQFKPGEAGMPGSAGTSDSEGGGLRPKVASMPLDPTDLGPSGASMTPTEDGALLQWRLPGNWQGQIATYRVSFPAVGYEMYRDEGARTVGDDGKPVEIYYEVVPIGAANYDNVGYIEFLPDPDDPEGSTYVIWREGL